MEVESNITSPAGGLVPPVEVLEQAEADMDEDSDGDADAPQPIRLANDLYEGLVDPTVELKEGITSGLGN
jgi:hypothetical protein